MLETTGQGFALDVIEASRKAPVLVDFWAPWCGPCRTLSPMLATIEQELGGRLTIVKVNVDEHQQLAAQYGVRSIPYVVAFVDGQPVDSFVGVLPAAQLRQFVDRLLPDPAEIERRKAALLHRQGDRPGAIRALHAALALDPGRDAVRLDLTRALLEGEPGTAALDEAAACLAGISASGKLETQWTALAARLQSLRRAAELPGEQVLQQRIAAEPADLQARLDLANLYVAQRRFDAALEQALSIVERDRAFGDDVGRRTMLAIFEIAADQPPLVSAFRRRLAAALNR
jgi:putative thioredoxin